MSVERGGPRSESQDTLNSRAGSGEWEQRASKRDLEGTDSESGESRTEWCPMSSDGRVSSTKKW